MVALATRGAHHHVVGGVSDDRVRRQPDDLDLTPWDSEGGRSVLACSSALAGGANQDTTQQRWTRQRGGSAERRRKGRRNEPPGWLRD